MHLFVLFFGKWNKCCVKYGNTYKIEIRQKTLVLVAFDMELIVWYFNIVWWRVPGWGLTIIIVIIVQLL